MLVLFVVLWQSLQQQNRTIQDLVNRLDGLEAIDRDGTEANRQLVEQQIGVLQKRQQKLQRKISNLENWQRASGDRERALWNRLDTPLSNNPSADLIEKPDPESTAPPELPVPSEQTISP